MKKLLFLTIFCSVPAVGMTAPSVAQERRRDDATERLFAAVRAGDVAAAQRALTDGANVNQRDEDGLTPLHIAVTHGYLDLMELLVANKANVNVMNDEGYTPLMWTTHRAGEKGVAMAKVLLENGADPNIQGNDRHTILHKVAERCDYDLAVLLVKHGAHADLENDKGETPVDIARRIKGEDSEIYKLLVEEVRTRKLSRVKGIPSEGEVKGVQI